MTRIAIDAMGGDHAPAEIVAGALWAAQEYNIGLDIVGKEDEIKAEIDKIVKNGGIYSDCGKKGRLRKVAIDVSKIDYMITHAAEVIEMGEAVGQAIRRKKDSSIVKAVSSIAEGRSDAVVAAGSTGAAMAASLFGLGRIRGITRPAIAVTLPTVEKPIILIDGGANSDATPQMLKQFAIMGATYSRNVLGIDNPRVGVLNIGEEVEKGNPLAKETHKLLEEDTENINFVGNIEGKEIFLSKCDVVVCDGFVGNVALKVTEGASSMLFYLLQQELKSDILGMIIGLLAKPFMRRVYRRINYEEFGGCLLLGVKGISVIAHGRSKAYAIKNAIRVAKEAVHTGVNRTISEFLEG